MDFERRFHNALRDLRSLPVEGFEGAATALGVGDKASRRRSVRLLLPIGAGGIALAMGCLLFLPRPAPAVSLEDMRQAVASGPPYHLVAHGPQGQTYMDSWWQDGKFLTRNREGWVNCRTSDVEWSIQPWSKTARIGKPNLLSRQEPLTDLDSWLRRLKMDLVPGYVIRTIQRSPSEQETIIEGKTKWGYGQKFRYHVRLEKASRLPKRLDTYVLDAGKKDWKRSNFMLIDYGVRIPESEFQFRPPKGYMVFDHLAAIRSIQDGVAGKGPSQTVEGVSIRLLGAFHESNGWVRVLWCGGATPHANAEGGVLDEKGVGYKVETEFEADDRRRPRNNGVQTAETKKPKMQRVGFDRPFQIRPLAYIGDTPIYAMRTMVEYAWPIQPRKLHVIIPVCKKGEPREVKPWSQGMTFRADGVQVGKAEFDVTTQPTEFLGFLLRQLDPNMMRQWGCAPMKGINVDDARSTKLAQENERLFMAQQQADADRMTFSGKRVTAPAKKRKG